MKAREAPAVYPSPSISPPPPSSANVRTHGGCRVCTSSQQAASLLRVAVSSEAYCEESDLLPFYRYHAKQSLLQSTGTPLSSTLSLPLRHVDRVIVLHRGSLAALGATLRLLDLLDHVAVRLKLLEGLDESIAALDRTTGELVAGVWTALDVRLHVLLGEDAHGGSIPLKIRL
jgi:hypothetical protein